MNGNSRRTRRVQETVDIPARPADVFPYLDDFRNIGRHMSGRAMPLMGGRLHLEQLAPPAGQGARWRWHGRVAGIGIDFTETVTERVPDVRKTWETEAGARLGIMERYRMGYAITPLAGGCRVTMWLEYNLPARGWWRVLARVLAGPYAGWCLRRMCRDAAALRTVPGGHAMMTE